MVELAGDVGYERVTVRRLIGLAGVSTDTFYKHFANTEQCFAGAYESVMRHGLRHASTTWRRNRHEDRETIARAVLQTVFDDLARNPKAARVVLVEAFCAGPAMQPRMRTAVGGFERLLAVTESDRIPQLIGRGIAAGVMRVARARLLAGEVTRIGDDADRVSDWTTALLRSWAAGGDSSEWRPAPYTPESADQPHDLTRAVRGEVGDERARILAAATKLSATHGFSELTIPGIRAEAGIARRRLDDHFEDAESCFIAAVESVVAHAAARIARAARRAEDWASGIDAAVRRLCTEVAGNPPLAHLLFVEILAPGREGLLCKERMVTDVANRMRAAAPPTHRLSAQFAEASSAAAWRTIRGGVITNRTHQVPRLAPVVLSLLLAPVAPEARAALLDSPR